MAAASSTLALAKMNAVSSTLSLALDEQEADEQAVIDNFVKNANIKEAEIKEHESKMNEPANIARYTTAFEGILLWIDNFKKREKARDRIILKEGKEAANADSVPLKTSRLLMDLNIVITELQKFIKTEGGANGGSGLVFPHAVLTIENVADFWIHADPDRRQAHAIKHLSVVEYMWLAAMNGYAAKNPTTVTQASVGQPHSIIDTYSRLLAQWLYWPLKETGPTPAQVTDMMRVVAAYTVFVINLPFESIAINMESAAMKKYITDRESDIAADTKREADFKKFYDEEIEAALLAELGGDDDEKKRAPRKKPPAAEPTPPVEAATADKAKDTREVILQRTNTRLSENFRDWRIFCPMISISLHVIYSQVLVMHGPKTVMYPYPLSKTASFVTCKTKLKEFLETKISFNMIESTKRTIRELIYELSLPFGAAELEQRIPEMSEETEYTGLFQALHKKGTSSIVGHRLRTTLQIVSKVKPKEAIEQMIVPAIWLGSYAHWFEQCVRASNWAATSLITPRRLRSALKKNTLRQTTRHGERRRPIIVVLGSSFYVHLHMQADGKTVSRLIRGDDVIDTLAIWTHLMMSDDYQGLMDNNTDINLRWLNKFR